MSGAAGMNFSGLSSGVTTLISGGYDLTKANKREKKLGGRPVYQIPNPTLKNQVIAENTAQQGMGSNEKQFAQQQAERGLSDSLDSLLKAGGGVSSISSLYSVYGDKMGQLAAMDDQIRFRNQQMLMTQNSAMADELDKEWQMNVFADWADQKQRIAELRALGNSKKLAGASMIAGSGGGGGDWQGPKRPDDGSGKINRQAQQQQQQGYGPTGPLMDNGMFTSGFNANGQVMLSNQGQVVSPEYPNKQPMQYNNNDNYILKFLYENNGR